MHCGGLQEKFMLNLICTYSIIRCSTYSSNTIPYCLCCVYIELIMWVDTVPRDRMLMACSPSWGSDTCSCWVREGKLSRTFTSVSYRGVGMRDAISPTKSLFMYDGYRSCLEEKTVTERAHAIFWPRPDNLHRCCWSCHNSRYQSIDNVEVRFRNTKPLGSNTI